MGHTHLKIKTIATLIPCDHNKGQEKYISDPVFTCVLLQPYTKNFSEGNKNGNFLTCLGLNSQQFFKHLPPSIATDLVHLDQEQNNLQSTKQVKYDLGIDQDKYFYPHTKKQ